MGYKFGMLTITVIGLLNGICFYLTIENKRAKKWFWTALFGVLGF